MPRLPVECIAKVIEWVDNTHDLFNLLTVSKNVFLIAARRLYRDPFVSRTDTYDDNIRKLVLFLLYLSPADGKNIEIIRQSNGLSPSGSPPDPQPMLNYLSLVNVIRWRYRDFYTVDKLCEALKYPSKDMYRTLTWAFVSHRLDEIEELEIKIEDQERYLNNAAKMTRLRKIWIYVDQDYNYKDIYSFVEAMIKAIQLHHGPYQLRECHMIPNSPFQGPIAIVPHVGINDYRFHDTLFSGTQRILSLLPRPRFYPTLLRPDGSTVTLNHVLDPYMTTIQEILCRSPRYSNEAWDALTKFYPGHSHAQILQRLRGMTFLSISPGVTIDDDEDLLAWAAYEAKHYNNQPGGHQLVPLERLEVVYSDHGSTPKLKIVQDGILGFSDTLKRLEVFYPRSADGMVDRLFTIPRKLYTLKTLILTGLAIDCSVWEQVPNIDKLIIRFDFPLVRFSATAPNASQDDQITEVSPLSPLSIDATTTTIAPATSEQQPQRWWPEFWFHCPKLTKLRLDSLATNFLDPNCLHHAPMLKSLGMYSASARTRNRRNEDGAVACDVWMGPRVLHPTRWTWDCSFPVLRTLSLKGDFHELMFSFVILRSCPALRGLFLIHVHLGHPFLLSVKGILNAFLNRENNQMLPFVHNNLMGIDLRGNWDIEADELACLLQVLPGLKKLSCSSIRLRFRHRELVEIAKTHTSLTVVTTDVELTSKSPEDLGLSYIKGCPEEVDAINRALYCEDDSKLPEQRTRIIYGFNSCRYYTMNLLY